MLWEHHCIHHTSFTAVEFEIHRALSDRRCTADREIALKRVDRTFGLKSPRIRHDRGTRARGLFFK